MIALVFVDQFWNLQVQISRLMLGGSRLARTLQSEDHCRIYDSTQFSPCAFGGPRRILAIAPKGDPSLSRRLDQISNAKYGTHSSVVGTAAVCIQRIREMCKWQRV